MKKDKDIDGVVYSTEHGRMCPACGKVATGCVCSRKGSLPAGDGTVRIRKETRGRNGKCVTVITGMSLGDTELREFARRIKQKTGTGGTVKNGIIEIQGDYRDMLAAELGFVIS